MSEKTRYSDSELLEFKELIQKKMAKAKEQLTFYQEQIINAGQNEEKYGGLEDGTMTSEKEALNNYAAREVKLIQNLEKALIRIENKTYGICRETGKLIPKERLLAAPHATLSIEAKKSQK
ncbi:MAG: TraR/DksA C4-type zinc finger protein [Chitinophagales bacterium]|nr:TraR/DksA C4-type zinc finger protein [Chitinophagales bacterium]